MAGQDLTPAQRSFLERFVLKAPIRVAASANAEDRDTVARVLARLGAMSAKGASIMKPRRDRLAAGAAAAKKALDSGKVDAGNRMLARLAALALDIARDIPLTRTYVVESEKFRQRLAEAQARRGGHGGIAIADYLRRMEDDEKRRRTAEERGDIRMALAACEAQDHRHGAMMQDADRGREFVARRARLNGELTRLENLAPGGGDAKPAIARVREMMNDAENFTKSGNWVGAVMMMRTAENALRVDTAGLDLSRKLKTDDSDVEATLTRCRKMLAGFGRMAGAALLKPDIREAAGRIDRAEKALPDVGKAQPLAREAAETCAALAETLAAASAWQIAIRDARTERDALAQQNLENCIAPEMARVDGALRASAKAAQARDFAAAQSALGGVLTAMTAAQDAARVYRDDVRAGRLALARAVKKLGPANDDARPLSHAFAALSDAYDKRDLPRARRLAAEAIDAARAAA